MKSVKCHECGYVGWADAEHCKRCGALRVTFPTGTPQQSQAYFQYPDGNRASSGGELKKGLAVASLVIGILDLFTLGLLGVGAIAGIVLSVVALSKAKRNPYEYGGQGLATAGLVMSILSAVMLVPLGLVAAIAIPNLMAARRAANEGTSIATLRTISSAQATYQSTSGNGAFGTLDQLAAEGLIKPQLAKGISSGYKFTIEIKTSDYDGQPGFQAVGVPLSYGSTGLRSFYVDETGIIRAGDNRGAKATELDEPLNSNGYSSSSPPGYSYDSRDY